MSPLTDSQTSLTLMEMLREDPRNAVAWDRFVRRYHPKIYGWCRAWGLQEADAEDVTQDVFAKLTEKMANFRYDQSRCFRAWLKTITQRVLSDLMASHRRAVGTRRSHSLRHGGSGRPRAADRGDLQSRVARPGDCESSRASRAGDVGCVSPDGVRRNTRAPRLRGCSTCRSLRSSWPSIASRRCSRMKSESWRGRAKLSGIAAAGRLGVFRSRLPAAAYWFPLRRFRQIQPEISVKIDTAEIVGTTPRMTGCPSSAAGREARRDCRWSDPTAGTSGSDRRLGIVASVSASPGRRQGEWAPATRSAVVRHCLWMSWSS